MSSTIGITIILSILCVVFGYFSVKYISDLFVVKPYEEATVGDVTSIEPIYISESFGTYETSGDEVVFVTEYDESNNTLYDYVAVLSADVYNSEKIQAIIKYSYQTDDSNPPATYKIKGRITKMESDLQSLVYEDYSYWNSNAVSDADTDYYLGNYYIDGTDTASGFGFNAITIIAIVFLIFTIVSIVALINTLRIQKKRSANLKKSKELLETNHNYKDAMAQIESASTILYKKSRVYITNDYMVSYSFNGLDIFRIADINELYGYDKNANHVSKNFFMSFMFGFAGSLASNSNVVHELVAVLSDGSFHEFAALSVKANKEHSKIVTDILRKNSSLTLGRNATPGSEVTLSPDALDVSKLKGFYGSNDVWSGRSTSVL